MALNSVDVELKGKVYFSDVDEAPREFENRETGMMEVQTDFETELPIYQVHLSTQVTGFSGAKQMEGFTVSIPMDEKQHAALQKLSLFEEVRLIDVTVRATSFRDIARMNFRAKGIEPVKAASSTPPAPAAAQRQG